MTLPLGFVFLFLLDVEVVETFVPVVYLRIGGMFCTGNPRLLPAGRKVNLNLPLG